MRLATWNVNSLNVRLPHLLSWLGGDPMDVVCLQETKLTDDKFPREGLEQAGYRVWYAGQKTYNGVAVLSRLAGEDPLFELPGAPGEEKRFLAVTIAGVRVMCLYVPNGAEVGSEKYAYKLAWLAALERHVGEVMGSGLEVVLAGDFNIAPEDRDVHDPVLWGEGILVSPPEREAFRRLLGLGLVDCVRRVDGASGVYTWWDYRMGSFRRNLGLRIDHVLVSAGLGERLRGGGVNRGPRGWERPSDHAPVWVEFGIRNQGTGIVIPGL